jgi:NADPH-dependent ferric siderophore reductase
MELVRRPIKARVMGTRVLTRQLVRVTVTAAELDRFEYGGPDQLVRIFLPPRRAWEERRAAEPAAADSSPPRPGVRVGGR